MWWLIGLVGAWELRVSRHMGVEIGDALYDVTDFGAKGDGKTDDTKAIQAALDKCDPDGGTVLIPDKTFLTFALEVKAAKTELRIEGTLLVSNDRDDWPDDEDIITSTYDNVAITGGGLIDGQGEVWWENRDDFRPKTVSMHGDKCMIHNITVKDPPNHCLELSTDWLELSHVKITAPPSTGVEDESHNTDAVDVHGEYMYIHDVYFDTGDDNVAVHDNHTLVENSYFGNGHGASIGSLCDSWITNFTVKNVTFNGTTNGARIKTHENCKGKVWNVIYQDLTFHNVKSPIEIDMFYGDPGDEDKTTMHIDNVTFTRISSSNPDVQAYINCHPDSPCTNMQFYDLSFEGDDWGCDNDDCCNNIKTWDVNNVAPPGLSKCLDDSYD